MSTVPLEVFRELAPRSRMDHADAPGASPARAPLAPVPGPDTPRDDPFATVEAVAFDLDGTLVDFLAMKRNACDAAAHALVGACLPADPRRVAQRLLELCFHLGVEFDAVVEAHLIDELGVVDPHLLAAASSAWEAAEAALTAIPGVHATLQRLRARGFPLALVTDAPGHKARERLEAAGLQGYFDVILTPEDHPAGKTDDSPFIDLLTRWSLPPEQVAMVGDNPARDVRHPRALGIRTILAAYGLQPTFASDHPRDRPHAHARSVEGILAILPHHPGPAGGERNT